MVIDSSSSSQGNGVNSLSWAHTCSGSDLVLVVGVAIRRTFGGTVVTPTVTYNGVSMTQINTNNPVGTPNRVTMFRLVNPATGANTIAVDFSDSSTYQAIGGGISLRNADISSPDDGTNTATGESTAASVSVNTSNNNSMVIDCCMSQDSGLLTVGSGQTSRWSKNIGASYIKSASSTELQPLAGSTEMSWTLSVSDVWVINALGIKAGPPIAFSISDNIGITEIISTIREVIISVLDYIGITENSTVSILWTKIAKNISTWTNRNKSQDL